jgi:hypothetical protein
MNQRISWLTILASASVLIALGARAEIKVQSGRNENAAAGFKFNNVPAPSRTDAATRATFTLVDGERDGNGGALEKLHDGRLPREDDSPSENFFFNAGTDGGRILIDLGGAIDVKQINTYSCHPNTRGPQVYIVYAADGTADNFNRQPKRSTDPATCGWKRVAKVDTRAKDGASGGVFGVSIAESDGALGKYRYVLFDVFRTETEDDFGNTFYSEIDVIDANAPSTPEQESTAPVTKTFSAGDGRYQITIDTTAAQELSEWAWTQLAPVTQEWYPKLVAMLPSEGYQAPTNVTIVFREGMGRTPAAAGGNRISCNIGWFNSNLKGEARGSVVHEMVHVVQQYGRARRTNPNATRAPGWLTEGIADYLRWFKYEPQSRGAEITARNISRAKYDASYRITANFLNWTSEKYDKALVAKLNAAIRDGNYEEGLWKKYTGHSMQELGDEWKSDCEKRIAENSPPAAEPKPKAP